MRGCEDAVCLYRIHPLRRPTIGSVFLWATRPPALGFIRLYDKAIIVMRVASFDIGVRNMCVCVWAHEGEDDKHPRQILHWELVDIASEWSARAMRPPPRNYNTVTATDAVRYAVAFVRDRERRGIFHGIDLAAIEQQPAGRGSVAGNIKMKCVSHALQAWFIDRRIAVRFCSPQRKIRTQMDLEHNGPIGPIGDPAEQKRASKKRYRKHKEWAVTNALELVQACGTPAQCTFFTNLQKKDDAADSLLQASWAAEDEVVLRAKQRAKTLKVGKRCATACAKEARKKKWKRNRRF